ncbi:MAG TPA: (d)CMP kinase [Stellaceae bacterium]|nr:(d)CMP kinase [Stellaceae bacterium]
MIIAIDGPAASGKGTLARRLAQHLGLAHLDTGRLYRAVALRVLTGGAEPADPASAEAAAEALTAADLKDPRLREERVAQASSVVAAVPAVRQALLAFQRDFARRPPGGAQGAVLDGRDIGTVICPDAEAKLFVTATTEARARRRFEELRESGEPAIYKAVLQDMKVRDARDSDRRAAPLVPADDAFVLDTTALDADATFAAALDFVERKLAERRG